MGAFLVAIETYQANISNRPIIIGIVMMESNVLSTYRALECAASLLYSCAIEVTGAQAGVMADRNTVMRIALPSAIQVDAWMTLRRSSTTIGTTSRRSTMGR